MIYLDNAATTRMFEGAVGEYQKFACNLFYNPSAFYREGREVKACLDQARKSLLKKLGATKGDIIFTSGATESNNLAIMGAKRNGSWEYIFSMGEHPSVYNVAKELEQQGCKVHYLPLLENGQVDYSNLEKLINDKTRLVCVMHVSNETGVVNDIEKISEIIKTKSKALLHVDGVQAFNKIDFALDKLNVDSYTISAHKFHGPKGVGALYVKNKSNIKNIVFGGGQEENLRSGTENTSAIMAMKWANEHINVRENFDKALLLKQTMTKILLQDDNIKIIDSESPYIMSVSYKGVNGETLARILQDEGVLVSTGSACSTKKAGNRTLESMGLKKEDVVSSIRISFNAYMSEAEIKDAGEIILKCASKLSELKT